MQSWSAELSGRVKSLQMSKLAERNMFPLNVKENKIVPMAVCTLAYWLMLLWIMFRLISVYCFFNIEYWESRILLTTSQNITLELFYWISHALLRLVAKCPEQNSPNGRCNFLAVPTSQLYAFLCFKGLAAFVGIHSSHYTPFLI